MISPTQRSLKLLREQGWHCDIVEHWNPFAKIRQDLWGFCDILCLDRTNSRIPFILAVQTTTLENMNKRISKILASDVYPLVRGRIAVQVHGWRKLKTGWACKIEEM